MYPILLIFMAWFGNPSTDQLPKEQVLFESGMLNYNCFRIPALVQWKPRVILAFAEGRKNNCSDFGDVDILMRKSTDGGKSWSEAVVVASNGKQQAGNSAPVMDYTDKRFPDGRLFLFYNTGNASEHAIREGKGQRRVWYKTSSDEGKTWDEPVEITEAVHSGIGEDFRTHALTPGHALQFHTGPYKGRLYIPSNHSQGPPQEGFKEYRAYGFYSDDHGKSWQVSANVETPSSNEAIGAVLEDGSLMLVIREQSGEQRKKLIAKSYNGGQSWDEVYFDQALTSPVCQSGILSIGSILFYSGPNSPEKREKMTLKYSTDKGKNWDEGTLVFEGSAAYSDLVDTGKKKIGILFERNDYTEIAFTSYPLKAFSKK